MAPPGLSRYEKCYDLTNVCSIFVHPIHLEMPRVLSGVSVLASVHCVLLFEVQGLAFMLTLLHVSFQVRDNYMHWSETLHRSLFYGGIVLFALSTLLVSLSHFFDVSTFFCSPTRRRKSTHRRLPAVHCGHRCKHETFQMCQSSHAHAGRCAVLANTKYHAGVHGQISVPCAHQGRCCRSGR